jgi:hypothetical protein
MYSSLPGKTGSNVWEIGIAESNDLIHWIKSTFSPVEMNLSCKPNDSKHHEGFAMFHSKADSFNIVDANGNFQY